ncbi:MAG: LCP family protein, partial [Candidatus Doudnabacteria bacterium]|nr:LCP family protein [Candidatus Doudnabacteria bacterium]
DFKGFEKAINLIGGVDVRIDKTFTDYEYPDENKGYLPPLTFEEGLTNMDGTKALQFSRSRHGNNGEGSDFARSLRQQKVMSAFKTKVLNLNLISDAGTINRLLGTFADHFHTNIGPGEMFRLYKIITEKNIQKFLSISLDQESGLLCSKILEENSAWVLVPCEGKSKDDIKQFFQNSFALGALREEKSVVWLGAGPNNKQAYGQADKILKQAGLTVWEIGYDKETPTENLVFQVNPKPATLDFIKKNLNATEVTLPPPGIKIDSSKVDIIIILGKNN